MQYLEDKFCPYTFESQIDLELLNQAVIVSITGEVKMFPWNAQQSIYKPERSRAYLACLHLVTWL